MKTTNLKITNRQIKTSTNKYKHNDGSTETIEEFEVYFDNIDTPAFVCMKVVYRDPNGKIDKDKSFVARDMPCGFHDDIARREEYTDSDSESVSGSDSKSDTESDSESPNAKQVI